jgi:hypothetical protein
VDRLLDGFMALAPPKSITKLQRTYLGRTFERIKEHFSKRIPFERWHCDLLLKLSQPCGNLVVLNILEELNEARSLAKELGQPSAMVAASLGQHRYATTSCSAKDPKTP